MKHFLTNIRYRHLVFLALLFCAVMPATAQKVFTEGTVSYRVVLESADHVVYKGFYTFTIKGDQIRKELRLNNGYENLEILNCGNNTAYSLHDQNGKKYAIELSMGDLKKRQEHFAGFTIKNETGQGKSAAGYAVYKGNISYPNGNFAEIYYIKDWYPLQPITFEHFPNCRFFPMSFSYTENNTVMNFELEKFEPRPIDNATFRIPADYKMISNAEYRQMSK